MRGLARLLVALLVIVVSVASEAPATAARTVQPGALMRSSVGQCTMSFIFVGGGSTYVGTAAHCVDRVGESVRDQDGAVFGTVAARGNPNVNARDWALIKVAAGFAVSPAVIGHPSGVPSGVTSPSLTTAGDLVRLSGHGLGFGTTAPTRQERRGTLTFDDANEYAVVAPAVWGDSGGPVVHVPTGRALGIVSRLCLGTCTEMGPTVQGIIAKAKAAGFDITLRTA